MNDSDWKSALARTRQAAFGRVASLFGATELDDQFWQELEAQLIAADLGIETTAAMIDALQKRVGAEGWLRRDQALDALRMELTRRFKHGQVDSGSEAPQVIILVGVNGSGKTTTVARLAHYYQERGAQVLMAAADTYRAAAVEQLERWAGRLQVGLEKGQPGGDPAAVVYVAAERAQQESADVLLVDTSGRMQTSHNLMAELEKICRVSGKVIAGAPHHVWLVLDATTGQNAISQARGFAEAVRLDGVILAKLDSSARGGAAVAIGDSLDLPILFVGTGEGIGDLARFDRAQFVEHLISAA